MNNPALKNGLIGGALSAILSILLGFVAPREYVSWTSGLPYIIIIVFMILAASQQKTMNNGLISFGDAFVAAFVSMSIAMAIWQIVVFLQYNFIQPDLDNLAKEVALEALDKGSKYDISGMLGKDGLEAYEQILEQAREDLSAKEKMITVGATIINYFFSLVIGAIISLIVAATMKSSNA